MPLLSIWEGVALSLNIDPDRVNRQVSMGGYDNATFRESKEFMDRMEIAVRHGCTDKLYMQTLPKDEDANVSQGEFWIWAKTVDWEVPDEITTSKPDLNRWRQEDLWVESELMALCCGFNPESSEDFFAKESVKSKLASAKERIQRAITSKVLVYDYNHGATQLEREQNKCYLFRPSDAIAWAAPKFPDFPFPLENKPAEPISESLPLIKQHYTDKLVYMMQASDKFWATADQKNAALQPEKKDIEKWLVGKGFGTTLATHAATIIRPTWAKNGRRPDEE